MEMSPSSLLPTLQPQKADGFCGQEVESRSWELDISLQPGHHRLLPALVPSQLLYQVAGELEGRVGSWAGALDTPVLPLSGACPAPAPGC